MPLTAEHQQFIANAQRRTDEYRANQESQEADGKFEFAEIGAYVPSDTEKEQMRRLAAIQERANKAPFNNEVRF